MIVLPVIPEKRATWNVVAYTQGVEWGRLIGFQTSFVGTAIFSSKKAGFLPAQTAKNDAIILNNIRNKDDLRRGIEFKAINTKVKVNL